MRRTSYTIMADDSATYKEYRDATDYLTALAQQSNHRIFSATFVVRYTLKSALRCARRCKSITGVNFMIQRRSKGKMRRREKMWYV